MQEKPKKKLTKQQQNMIDATTGGGINSRPVFTGPNSYILPKHRPDTPLAPTPEPRFMAEGVVISKKDENAHPEDFKYLKKK